MGVILLFVSIFAVSNYIKTYRELKAAPFHDTDILQKTPSLNVRHDYIEVTNR